MNAIETFAQRASSVAVAGVPFSQMLSFASARAYLNFTSEDRVREAFGEAKYERLVALKDRYDPDNPFRLNQNNRPSSQTGEPAIA